MVTLKNNSASHNNLSRNENTKAEVLQLPEIFDRLNESFIDQDGEDDLKIRNIG